jgi:hypothetical protein
MEVNMDGRGRILVRENDWKAEDDCTQNGETEVNIDVGEAGSEL